MIGTRLLGSGCALFLVSSVALWSTTGAASAPVQPVTTVVAEIPEGRFIASDLFTGRPMIDFSDDFQQSVYVESSLSDRGAARGKASLQTDAQAPACESCDKSESKVDSAALFAPEHEGAGAGPSERAQVFSKPLSRSAPAECERGASRASGSGPGVAEFVGGGTPQTVEAQRLASLSFPILLQLAEEK